MSQDDRSTSRKDEYLGVALFLLGVVPLVLVLTALMREPDPDRGTTAMQTAALALIDAFGAVPCLLAGLGLAGIGGWIFAGNPLTQPSRHLLGVGGAATGLAVLLGAFDPAWGGRLGLKTGGALASVTPLLGGLAGVLVILGSAYVAWLHGRIELPARKPRKVATLGDALSEKDADGVSVAESNALVPDASTLDYMEDLWASGHQRVQKVPMPPSPYPEDVRLQGGVPEGATVLPSDDEEDLPELEDLDLAHRWERADPEAPGAEPAGADLAGGDVAGAAPGRSPERPVDADESEEVAIARLLSAPAGEPLADHEPAPARPTPVTRALDDDAPAAGSVPRPSWELDAEVELGEPVPLAVEPEADELEDEGEEASAEYEAEEDSEEEDEAAEYEEEDAEGEDDEESEAAEYEEEEDEDEESDAEAAEYGEEEEDAEEDSEAAEYEDEEDSEEEDEAAEYEEEDGEYEDDEESEAAEYEEQEEEDEESDAEAAEYDDEDEDAEEDPEAAEYEDEEDSEEEDEAAEYEEEDGEYEDDEESEAAEYEEEDEDGESDAEAAEYDEEEEDAEEDPEAEYEEEDSEEEDEAAEYEEEDAEDEEPEAAADDSADDSEEEAELDEAEVEAALDDADEDVAAEAEEELLDELEQEAAEEAAEAELEEAAAEAEQASEEPDDEPAAETEPEVVLEPAPAPKARKSRAKSPAKAPARAAAKAPAAESEPAPAPKRSGRGSKKAAAAAEAAAPAPAATATLVAALGDRRDLVRDCGALFVEQGRVAVSLLQRQFDLDFEQACEILDDLQELGLIGPYMGGQQRDILLDAGEWQERMTAS